MDTIAAIDIGSNALRASIAQVQDGKIKIIKNFRDPLRLGEDVFKSNKISPKRIKRTKEIFDYLIHLFADHDVTHTKACATSAMRDADNSNALIEKIKKSSGIQIQCIGGLQEAKLIYEAVRTKMNIENSNTLLVDIGGGSTEITVAKDNKVLASKSFNIGTVRLLKEKKIEVMESIIEEHIFAIEKYLRSKMKIHKIDYAIGTGGNLRRMGKLRRKILEKKSSSYVTAKDIKQIYDSLIACSFQERVKLFEMRKDRADVIIPATYIIKALFQRLHLKKMFVPEVGLKEGILLSMVKSKKKSLVLPKN